MRFRTPLFVVLICSSLLAGKCAAADAHPDYRNQIQPFFQKYCLGCHAGDDETQAGLGLQSFDALMKGGDNGKVLVPGKSGESRLIQVLLGSAKPKMPPKDAVQPKPDEIALVKRWVDLGAIGPVNAPSGSPGERSKTVDVPNIRPRKPVAAPLTSICFSPDGQQLAVAVHKAVWILNATTGDLIHTFNGAEQPINSVAFSPDGRLVAAAEGTPGLAGRVLIWTLGVDQPRALAGHADSVYAVAFSPDNKRLISASYDKLLLLWDVASGKTLATLKHHTGPVFAATFSADGKWVASASGDQTAKIWNAATGERVATMSEPRKSLSAIAFQPAGREVAAAGSDKMIRIWEWDGSTAHFRLATFAHDAGILALAYSPDGKTLYSAGEDRLVRAWDAATLAERFVTVKLSDWPLALAISPDGSRLAVPLFNGSLVIFDTQTHQQLKNLVTGGRLRELAPRLDSIEPQTAMRGQKVKLKLVGRDIAPVDQIFTDPPGLKVSLLPANPNSVKERMIELELPADLPPGPVQIRAHTTMGDAGTRSIHVGPFPETRESKSNDTLATAVQTQLPATWLGTIERRGDRDCWAFDAKVGQEVVFQGISGVFGKKLSTNLQLTLRDSAGASLATSQRVNYRSDVTLGYRIPRDGRYCLEVADRDFTGSAEHLYVIHAGSFAYVTEVFPLGARLPGGKTTKANEQTSVALSGFNLPAAKTVRGKDLGLQKLRVDTPQGPAFNVVQFSASDFSEFVEQEPNDSPAQAKMLPIPGAVSGRISRPMVPGGTSADLFAIDARKGQRLVVEVFARRHGSPLDSVVDILTADGKPLIQNTLRAVSETYTVLRDHSSSVEGIRLNNWEDFRINDYFLIGNEVVKLFRIPPLPDEDLRFYSNGQRLGYFGTTPEAHAINQPVYKVEVHPPEAKFSSNGMPIVQLPWKNDDGGPGFRGDSQLLFDVPADGRYLVRVRDVRDLHGDGFVYRLVVRPRHEDFRVSITPENPNVPRGAAKTVDVNIDRMDGFEGAVDVTMEELPPGITVTPVRIEAGTFRGQMLLSAAEDAPAQVARQNIKSRVVARAKIGKDIVERTTSPLLDGHQVSVAPAPDFLLKVDPPTAKIAPGKFVKFTVTLERRGGFADRVPVLILNLPMSMFVVDLGLNGVLITEQSTTQTFVVGCYSFAQPGKYPIYASGKQEAKGLDCAAPPILLEVENSAGTARAEK